MNKKVIIIGILTVILALGFSGYIYWTNKDVEVTQKPDAVEVNDVIDDKVATSTETADTDNKTVDNETANSFKVQQFFTDCLKVMNNINDTSNTEEMKPVRQFMAENVDEDYINVCNNNYKENKSCSLKSFNLKEIKKGTAQDEDGTKYNDVYIIRYDYELLINNTEEYKKTDAEGCIEQKDGKYVLLQFEAK